MPKKATIKKKVYQRACREQRKNGNMNDELGVFRPKSHFKDSSMRRDYFGGKA